MMERSQRKNKAVLDSILKRLVPEDSGSVICPTCHVEWNRLTPNGLCYECDPVEQSDRKKFYGG